MADYITDKDKMRFKDISVLQKVVAPVLREASAALNNPYRTIDDSPIDEMLAGATGMAVGGGLSLAALYFGGTVGLSAAGITSGLAAAGAVIGGGMAAGVAVLAAPIALLGMLGVAYAKDKKLKELINAKISMYNEAIEKQNAIIRELKRTRFHDRERIKYLTSINKLLLGAINDLGYDLGVTA